MHRIPTKIAGLGSTSGACAYIALDAFWWDPFGAAPHGTVQGASSGGFDYHGLVLGCCVRVQVACYGLEGHRGGTALERLSVCETGAESFYLIDGLESTSK